MIVSKNSDAQGDSDSVRRNRGTLSRKDMRRGRQVVVWNKRTQTATPATIMSSPFDEESGDSDRENGQKVWMRTNVDGKDDTNAYYLHELGVEPDRSGGSQSDQSLLDANKYGNRQLCEDGSEPLDPPER